MEERESGTIEEELKLNNFPHEMIIRERKAIKKQRERAAGRTASERTTGE